MWCPNCKKEAIGAGKVVQGKVQLYACTNDDCEMKGVRWEAIGEGIHIYPEDLGLWFKAQQQEGAR